MPESVRLRLEAGADLSDLRNLTDSSTGEEYCVRCFVWRREACMAGVPLLKLHLPAAAVAILARLAAARARLLVRRQRCLDRVANLSSQRERGTSRMLQLIFHYRLIVRPLRREVRTSTRRSLKMSMKFF